MKDSLRFSLTLFLICLISAALLTFVFRVAEPKIIEQQRLAEQQAIREVVPPQAEVFEKVEEEDVMFYRVKDEQENLIAYVFIAQGYGYSSDIKSVVSLKPDGDIMAVKILEQKETPGIGSRILEDDFLNQFKNKGIDEEFDAISSATISSSAVIESIKEKGAQVMKYVR